MEILLAEEMGFCFGVKRAIDIAIEASEASKDGDKVWTLGSIVHNPQVVARLETQGVGLVHNVTEIPMGTVVISSHGVSPQVVQEAEARGLKIVDATCPIVRASQWQARRLAEAKFLVVIFGDREHSEVKGLMGWTVGKGLVISKAEELETLPPARKVALLAQTTQSVRAFEEIANRLVQRRLSTAIEISIQNTICEATAKRQKVAIELARRVDTIIVVGGMDSANTRRLAQLCAAQGVATYHVETAEEIQLEWLAGCQRVGVTAGASTPDWVIQEVEDKVRGGAGA